MKYIHNKTYSHPRSLLMFKMMIKKKNRNKSKSLIFTLKEKFKNRRSRECALSMNTTVQKGKFI